MTGEFERRSNPGRRQYDIECQRQMNDISNELHILNQQRIIPVEEEKLDKTTLSVRDLIFIVGFLFTTGGGLLGVYTNLTGQITEQKYQLNLIKQDSDSKLNSSTGDVEEIKKSLKMIEDKLNKLDLSVGLLSRKGNELNLRNSI